jgi:hypothetical protein
MIQYHSNVTAQRLTSARAECFFGYYDKCPWSRDKCRIITGVTSVKGKVPDSTDVLQIGFVYQNEGAAFTPVGETRAWNFQQGAMAQWINYPGGELILYNTSSGNQAHALLVDHRGQRIKKIERAIYSLSPDHQWAASIDFGRLQKVRPGYGYAGVRGEFSDQPSPDMDGLWLINLRTDEARLVVSYHVLAQEILPRGEVSSHWIDHIEFSPDGQWLVFLHRWLAADGGLLTRVIALNRQTGATNCLLDCGAAGHGVWLDSAHYGIWGRRSTLASRARTNPSAQWPLMQMAIRLARRFIPAAVKGRIHQETFLSIHMIDESSKDVQPQIPMRHRQGHPSLRPGGQWLVSDTLPDQEGRRTLFISSLDGKYYIPLITVTHPPESANSPFRCDLHPRWDRAGHSICIDSMHEGFRGMYAVSVPSKLLESA